MTKENKFVHSFSGRIYGAPICFRLYLTFTEQRIPYLRIFLMIYFSAVMDQLLSLFSLRKIQGKNVKKRQLKFQTWRKIM
jgi:hypothetical protein